MPESRAISFDDSGSASGVTDVLTGESSADNIDPLEVSNSDMMHILVTGDVRPVFRQNGAAVLVFLNLPQYTESRSLEPELETSDAAEQRADRQCHSSGSDPSAPPVAFLYP